MKTIITYQCEICKRTTSSEEGALSCEAQGTPDLFPVGLVFGHKFYPGYTFAVSENNPQGHRNEPACWACRPNGTDTLGEHRCGSGGTTELGVIHAADPSLPTFQRLAAWLREQGLPVRYWDGERIVEPA